MTVLVNALLFTAGLLELAVCAGLLARLAGAWVVRLVRGGGAAELSPPAEP